MLHYFDKCAAKDNNLNLAVLWWKAISGNRVGSSTFDGFIAYDLLPPITRFIVGFPFSWLYPNLHHQNVALRTAFLDKSVLDVLREDQISAQPPTNNENVKDLSTASDYNDDSLIPRVITLGAGFDTRSLRFRGIKSDTSTTATSTTATSTSSSTLNADFYEVDLPAVVSQKSNIFQRYLKRRPNSILPKLYGADLNDLDEVKKQLGLIFSDKNSGDKSNSKKRKTVFVIEAVLMYLKEENVMPLLSACMIEAAKHSSTVELCFADRLPGMPQNDTDLQVEKEAAEKLLRSVGLDLLTWQPKPGRARHMGIASYKIK